MSASIDTARSAATSDKLRIGVSSCLLGEEVRWDGGHKRDRFVTDRLGEFFDWVSVCPEVEAGFGLPRPTVQLYRIEDEVRMRETKSGEDRTSQMQRYASKRVRALRALDLCGYVLKKDSPSCGAFRVKVYSGAGPAKRDGSGLFAAKLMEAMPNLPVEEEGRLNDPPLRENFIERVFAYARLRELFTGRVSSGRIVAFHTAHKLQVMAHSPVAYRELGRLVADVGRLPRAEFRKTYEDAFMAALGKRATPGRNANVLQHAAGYFRKQIDSASRTELADLIHDYRLGLVPLVVPITLIAHYARRFEVDYLRGQTYLEPHPKELMLRNHV